MGMLFYVFATGILYLLVDRLRVPLLWSTLCAAEFTAIVRFFVNDRWVFRERRPTWNRFWKFHIGNAAGFAIWWVAANALPRFGVHYLIASTAGTALSMLSTLATNFLWIWRDAVVMKLSAIRAKR